MGRSVLPDYVEGLPLASWTAQNICTSWSLFYVKGWVGVFQPGLKQNGDTFRNGSSNEWKHCSCKTYCNGVARSHSTPSLLGNWQNAWLTGSDLYYKCLTSLQKISHKYIKCFTWPFTSLGLSVIPINQISHNNLLSFLWHIVKCDVKNVFDKSGLHF